MRQAKRRAKAWNVPLLRRTRCALNCLSAAAFYGRSAAKARGSPTKVGRLCLYLVGIPYDEPLSNAFFAGLYRSAPPALAVSTIEHLSAVRSGPGRVFSSLDSPSRRRS